MLLKTRVFFLTQNASVLCCVVFSLAMQQKEWNQRHINMMSIMPAGYSGWCVLHWFTFTATVILVLLIVLKTAAEKLTQNRPTGCSHDAFTRTEGPRCVWRQFKALVSQCYLLIVVICVHWGCTFTSITWIHLLCHCVDLEFCLNVCVSRSYSACWTLLRLIL